MSLVAYLDGDIASFVAAARVKHLGYDVKIATSVLYGQLSDVAVLAHAEEQAYYLNLPIERTLLTLPVQLFVADGGYIPHKNLVLASFIAHRVWGRCNGLIFGWCAQGGPYADTTLEFQRALARVLSISAGSPWTVHAPLLMYTIKEVVHMGRDILKLSLAEMTWSCHNSSDVHCGVCPGCLSRQKGFDIDDPTEYQNKGDQK